MNIRLWVIVLTFIGLISAASVAGAGDLWTDGKKVAPVIELNLPSFAPIVEKLSASVVNISVEGKEESPMGFPGGQGLENEEQENPFDYFFQMPPMRPGKRMFEGLGSGFVINSDGYIVTNNHVVDRASKITIKFKDDKESYTAKVVGSDERTDIALLKVEGAKNLSPAVLGDSDVIQPGDWSIAIGNPFSLGNTATVGIISAKSRRNVGGPYSDFIQTDASINPGNSGGPLFNARGEVIGVNTAIFSPNRSGNSGFNIGIGFATPINIVKEVIDQLFAKGKVTRGWLGVLIQPVTADAAKAMSLKSASGALVADVVRDSPAEKAGIKRGDVIVKYDNQSIDDNAQLPQLVGRTELGKSVSVVVLRENEEKTFKVKIEELKDEELAKGETKPSEEVKLGVKVQNLTPDMAKSLGIDESEGVVVTEVMPGGAAFESGLRRGDVIIEAGSRPVKNTKSFKELTKNVAKDKPILLLVRRSDHTIYLTIKLDEQ
ncbi:MAG: DegQ family serine endoprotease [Deltaproteobacteria bacterium]|nr:DegQ family serine endoprotease [Deltaproteobacteria bacterium]